MQIISSDLLRGHIDTFVLAALMTGRQYGNEIRRHIEKKTNGLYKPNEQSLYSAYHRLEEGGYIKGEWGGEITGVTRKYYTITEKGIALYNSNRQDWVNAKMLIDLLITYEK